MASYFGVAKDQGLSAAEIDAVKAIVMAVAAGQVRAQFADARMRYRSEHTHS
jgi:hypothetical protein